MASAGNLIGGAGGGAAAGMAGGPIGALVGGGIGLLGGLLAGGGPDPVMQESALSSGGRVNMDALNARAAQSQDQFAKESNQGIDEASKPLLGEPDHAAMAHDALGGGPALMGDALQNRMQTRYAGDMTNLRRQNEIGAYDRKVGAQNQAYSLNLQKQQIDNEMAAKQLLYQRASEEARNNALSSVLGSAGNMIGTAIGSAKPGSASESASGTRSAGARERRE